MHLESSRIWNFKILIGIEKDTESFKNLKIWRKLSKVQKSLTKIISTYWKNYTRQRLTGIPLTWVTIVTYKMIKSLETLNFCPGMSLRSKQKYEPYKLILHFIIIKADQTIQGMMQ